jgi:hypothetical protein
LLYGTLGFDVEGRYDFLACGQMNVGRRLDT